MKSNKQTFLQTVEIAKKMVSFFLQNKYNISDLDIEKFFDNLSIKIDSNYRGHTRGYYNSQNGIFIVDHHIPQDTNINILATIIHEIGHAVSDRFSTPEYHRILEEGMVTKFTEDCINYWLEHKQDISFLGKIEQDYLKSCGYSSLSYPMPTSIAKTFSLLANRELSKKGSSPDYEYFFGNKIDFLFALEPVFNEDLKTIISSLSASEYKKFDLIILKIYPYFESFFQKLPEKERNDLISNIESSIDVNSSTENSLYHKNIILYGLLLEHEFKHKKILAKQTSISSEDLTNLPTPLKQLVFIACGHGIYTKSVINVIQKFYQTSSLTDFLSIFKMINNLPPDIALDILKQKIENQDTDNFHSFVGKFNLPTFLKFNEKMEVLEKYMALAPEPSTSEFKTYINATQPIANGIIRLFNNLEEPNFKKESKLPLLKTFISGYQLATLSSNEPLTDYYVKALMLKIALSDRCSYGKNYLEFLKNVIILKDSGSNIINSISTDDFDFLTKKFFDDGINFCNPDMQKYIKSHLDYLMSKKSIDFIDSKRISATYKYFANSINTSLQDMQKLYPNIITNYTECFEHLKYNDFKNFHIDFSVPQNQEQANQNISNILAVATFSKNCLLPYLATGLNQNLIFQASIEEKVDFYKKFLQGNKSYRAKHLIKNAANFLADTIEASSLDDFKLLKDFADSIDLTDTSPSRAYKLNNNELEL